MRIYPMILLFLEDEHNKKATLFWMAFIINYL